MRPSSSSQTATCPAPRDCSLALGTYSLLEGIIIITSIILLPRSLRLSDHFSVGIIIIVVMSFSAQLRIGLGNEAGPIPNVISKHIEYNVIDGHSSPVFVARLSHVCGMKH